MLPETNIVSDVTVLVWEYIITAKIRQNMEQTSNQQQSEGLDYVH